MARLMRLGLGAPALWAGSDADDRHGYAEEHWKLPHLFHLLRRQNKYLSANCISRIVRADVTLPKVAALRASVAGVFQFG